MRARAADELVLLTLLVLPPVLGGTAAFAQTTSVTTEAEERPGRLRLGPVYLTPSFALKNAGVDTNALNTSNPPPADAAFLLTPALDAVWPAGSRLKLSGRGAVGLDYFGHDESAHSLEPFGEARADVDLGRVVLFGKGGASQIRSRYVIDNSERARRDLGWLDAGVGVSFTSKFGMDVDAGSDTYTYHDAIVDGQPVREVLDRKENTIGGRFRYGVTRLTNFTVSAHWTHTDFRGDALPGTNKADSRRYLTGFEFNPDALVHGKVLVGFTDFPEGTAVPSYRGLAFDSDLSFPVLKSCQVFLIALRNVRYSSSLALVDETPQRNSFVDSVYRADLSVPAPLELVLRGTAGLEHARYLLPVDDPLHREPVTRIDKLWTVGSVLRHLADRLLFGVSAVWSQRDSTIAGVAYEGWRYGFQMELVP